MVRDAAGCAWETERVSLPASWITALVNNDWSGLEDDAEDAAACRAWIIEAAEEGWRVVDVARNEEGDAEAPFFSSSAGFHGLPYSGADLLTYVRERRVKD